MTLQRLRGLDSAAWRAREGGQTLVFFALFLVVLLGAGALVVDVARVYSLQRYERSVADAAALAGAQDLQTPASHADVTTGQQTQARLDALTRAASTLGGTAAPSCNPKNDIVDCPIPGTDYQVSVKTPSPSVMHVDADRAVQVTIRQPAVSLTLARLFGQSNWNVAITSVAGLDFGAKYALITLRPPEPLKSGSDQNEKDINIDGGTVVDVMKGDVGTNTNVVISGTGSALNLTTGSDFKVFHFDTYQAWTSPPLGKVIPDLIPDPDYVIPSRTGAGNGAQDTTGCSAAIAQATAAGYVGHSSSTDPTKTFSLTTSNTSCWTPGIYKTNIGQGVGNTLAILLEPGVYFFDKGLSMNGSLIGGYQFGSYDSKTGQPKDHTGVTLVFPEANSVSQGAFAGNSATLVALNGGSCIASLNPANCKTMATPALAADGTTSLQVLFTSTSGDVVAPETIVVAPKDPNCQVVQPYNTGCNDNGNNTIGLPGGGNLFVAGVQYAPTDNVVIAGGASGLGYLGQIVAWTVHYTGGSQVGEVYPGNIGNGVLRLDEACSGPSTTCNP